MAKLDAQTTFSKIIEGGLESFNRFYSIYRGIVTDNTDPDNVGLLKVTLPNIQGGLTVKALPRGQHGADATGFKYFIPSIGDMVFISFEMGDLSQALWEYHGWANKECPFPLKGGNQAGIVTPRGNLIILDDNEGEETLVVDFKGNISIISEANISIESEQGVTTVKATGEVLVQSDTRTILNGESNDGLVNINPLTQKLNQLVQEIEALKVQLNAHVHTATALGSPTTPPVTPLSQTFSQFVATDYKDDKCVH